MNWVPSVQGLPNVARAVILASFVLAFLFVPVFSEADFICCYIDQDLSLEIGGTLIEGPAGIFDQFGGEVPPPVTLDGANILSPSQTITINFIDRINPDTGLVRTVFSSPVPQERGVYLLRHIIPDPTPEDGPEGDILAPGSFSLVHAPVPANDGDINTLESTSVTFPDIPAFGNPAAESGIYTVGVYEYPEFKYVYDSVTDEYLEETYTDADFLAWYEWQFVDYDIYEGDIPESADYAPENEAVFTVDEYTAATGPVYQECCSSVIFLPGLQGSVIADGADILWPPTYGHVHEDLTSLFLNLDGNPVNPDASVEGIVNVFPIGPLSIPIYQGFTDFMDALIADESDDIDITDWRAIPYDWRLSPEKAVEEYDMVSEVENLARTAVEHSRTGKVTIVAHSYGGLVGKALIEALKQEGKEDLVDSFVLVGSPQLGTPQAAAGLLHGEGSDIAWGPFIFVNKADPRALGQNMESAYHLLPSRRYFSDVVDPPVVFDSSTNLTANWRGEWGFALNSFQEFFDFLTGTVVPRFDPPYSDVRHPEILRADLFENADAFHMAFDTYDFGGIRVVQVAGWGLDTIKGLDYTENESDAVLDIARRITTEGDSTVVYPSALSSEGEKYYFNLSTYNALDDTPEYQHRDLVGAPPVLESIKSVIKKEVVSETDFLVLTKPNPVNPVKRLLVSVHSPMTLGAFDQNNNFTGITPGQDLDADILFVSNEIPGSSYFTFGEGKYLLLPDGGSYRFVMRGTGSGGATVNIQEIDNETVTEVASYSDIPVTEFTNGTFIVDTENPAPDIEIDQDGDDSPDLVVSPDGSIKTFEELLAELRILIGNLDASDKVKSSLLKRIEKLEKKIEKQKAKKSKTLENLEKQIEKKQLKGKIDTTSAGELIILLNELEAQAGTFPLNSELIAELRAKVEALETTQALKNSLLKKVNRLEQLAGISKTLSSFTSVVERKAEKGKITTEDTEMLVNLLTQLENAL